jgi:hypothetical protein
MGSGRQGEVDGGEWRRIGGSDIGPQLIKGRGRRGVGWFSSDAIGWGGGAPWTASWTGFSDANERHWRGLNRPGLGQFQSSGARFWSRAGHVDAQVG